MTDRHFMPKPFPCYSITSTPALDKVFARNAKVMAKVAKTQANVNAIIDKAFRVT